MSELTKQILSGDVETPTMGSQLARDGWYQAPTGRLTATDVNRAREALAKIQINAAASTFGQKKLTDAWVNVPVYEAKGLAGEVGPEFQALWLALNKAFQVCDGSTEDSSLSVWVKRGCPME